MRNDSTHQLAKFAALIAVSTLALWLAACADSGALDVQAVEPEKSASEQRALDPALNSLDGLTHHG